MISHVWRQLPLHIGVDSVVEVFRQSKESLVSDMRRELRNELPIFLPLVSAMDYLS